MTPQLQQGSQRLDADRLAQALIRIGEDGIAKENDAAFEAYFARDFVFHGPQGDSSRSELKAFFAAMRKAFTGLTVTRDRILVQGNIMAARTRMSGVFEHEFPYTPVGTVQPTGKPVSFYIHNFFRYDDDGRLAEEWAQLDNLGFLKQLGVELHRPTQAPSTNVHVVCEDPPLR
jgi:predicted ester cyclase